MIVYKKPHEIEMMRAAGRVVARTLRIVSESIVPGKTTPRELDALAERLIREAGGIPSFLHYRNYPAATCISVNEVVIHGIPDDRVLQEGDIVDLDFGVTLNGWVADGAWTYAVGRVSEEAQRLMNVTRESLMQGIAKARIGNRIGDIGATIQRYVERHGYSVVKDLVGHGVGTSVHEEPSVPNFGKPGKGPAIKEGMTICIEPMVNQGTFKVRTLADKWTVVTADGKLSAHYEHTVAITKDGPDILTSE
ncbi:MAG TPA: type I methionyl aminopeptidase [Fimbriimonadaceae bacterium]|nr:type I methionyl aminopeptidase [Fimbriimonadaceae bacterium]HRJ96418.1 type I methionyl aminopeptidase [Fimbriimonadaceae bacterium]